MDTELMYARCRCALPDRGLVETSGLRIEVSRSGVREECLVFEWRKIDEHISLDEGNRPHEFYWKGSVD